MTFNYCLNSANNTVSKASSHSNRQGLLMATQRYLAQLVYKDSLQLQPFVSHPADCHAFCMIDGPFLQEINT